MHLLIETSELEANLSDPDWRIIDCNIVMTAKPEGGYKVVSGRDDWSAAHIPNSVFVDIESELSADHPRLRFMMPSGEQFARVMSDLGIGDGHRVVVYSRGANFWATRLYLMFREFGFDNVSVLNGGWDKWCAEGRPTTDAPPGWPSANFIARPTRGIFVGKEDVLEAVDDPSSCVINALSPEIHSGERFNPPYGRPGHIAGSKNVFCFDLIDKESNRFLDDAGIEEAFAQCGALDAERVIIYCGGGISATTDAFALQLLGKQNVKVYDGSMLEWGNDPDLPMETD